MTTGAVSSFVCDLARDPRANEYRIVVKLHPSERNSWRVVHPELTEVGTRVEIAETGGYRLVSAKGDSCRRDIEHGAFRGYSL